MMNESMDESFSLDEIRKQLAALGYENVGQERLLQVNFFSGRNHLNESFLVSKRFESFDDFT